VPGDNAARNSQSKVTISEYRICKSAGSGEQNVRQIKTEKLFKELVKTNRRICILAVENEPVWKKQNDIKLGHDEKCEQRTHLWVAHFYQSGRLAYWACQYCKEVDRESELAERLEWFSAWIENPPKLIVWGKRPRTNSRKWETADGYILQEEDPSSIYFIGLEIPELEEANTYTKYDRNNAVIEKYEPTSERMGLYSDHYWQTRYGVIGTELVKFESHCFEESTFDMPNAGKPKKTKILRNLKLISGREDE